MSDTATNNGNGNVDVNETTPFDVNDELFQKLVPDFDPNNANNLVGNFQAILSATERELDSLKALKDSGDEKKVSPTALARKALLEKYSNDASEMVWDNIDPIVTWGFNSPKRFVALAESFREWADFFDYVGGLHVQDLRNSEYVKDSGSSEDAAEQREIVSRLILNTRALKNMIVSMHEQGMGSLFGITEEVVEAEVPSLRGIKIGSSSGGKRVKSEYPSEVTESRMEFNVDGKDLKAGTSLSDAIINYYFKAIGKDAIELTAKEVVDGLETNNPNWNKTNGGVTEFDFDTEDGRVVTFRVTIVSK